MVQSSIRLNSISCSYKKNNEGKISWSSE